MFVDVPIDQFVNGGRVTGNGPGVHRIFTPIDVALQALGLLPGGDHRPAGQVPIVTFLGLSGAVIGGGIGSLIGTAIDSRINASLTPDQRQEGAGGTTVINTPTVTFANAVTQAGML
jgi:hypothetical protein